MIALILLLLLVVLIIVAEIRSKGKILQWIVAGFIILVLAAIAIPNFLMMDYGHVDSNTKLNMYNLRLALEDFSKRTGGVYPVNFGITVKKILNASGKQSDDTISIAGVNRDTIFTNNIGSMGASKLTAQYKNFYKYKSNPVLIISHIDPPPWHKRCIGTVYYVPVKINGNIAESYKIYGAGEKGLLQIIMQPENEAQIND